eukprot:9213859-Karenia_brevis.AAC.1
MSFAWASDTSTFHASSFQMCALLATMEDTTTLAILPQVLVPVNPPRSLKGRHMQQPSTTFSLMGTNSWNNKTLLINCALHPLRNI